MDSMAKSVAERLEKAKNEEIKARPKPKLDPKKFDAAKKNRSQEIKEKADKEFQDSKDKAASKLGRVGGFNKEEGDYKINDSKAEEKAKEGSIGDLKETPVPSKSKPPTGKKLEKSIWEEDLGS